MVVRLSLVLALAVFVVFAVAAPASAVELYVATNGSDAGANNCQNINSPCATLQYALNDARCNAGDIINLRGGTYPGTAGDVSDNDVVFCSGTSYANAVTIRTYPPDFTRSGGSITSGAILRSVNLNNSGSPPQYHIWQNILIDTNDFFPGSGAHSIRISNGAHHIRILDMEIREAYENGVHNTSSSHDVEVLGTCNEIGVCTCNVHNHGVPQRPELTHGIYFAGDNNLVQGCMIHDNQAFGIQFWDEDTQTQTGNIARGNYVYNNGLSDPNGGGIVCGAGTNATVVNNVVYNNHDGILFSTCGGAGGVDTVAYHNTVYGSTRNGFEIQFGDDYIVRNNIIWNNTSNDQRYLISVNCVGTGVCVSNNLCDGDGTAANPTCAVNADPGFVNVSGGDFRLALGTSPAVDVGFDLSGIITTDFLGEMRPVDGPDADTVPEYDLGAHEFTEEGGTEDPPAQCSTQFNGTISVVGCAYSRSDTTQLAVAGPLDTTTCTNNCAYIVFLGHSSVATPTLTDSASNTYTCPAGLIITDTVAAGRICYVTSPTTSATLTITASSSGTDTRPIVFFLAVQGVGSSPVDQLNTTVAGSAVTSLQPGSVTPTGPPADNHLIITAIVHDSGCSGHTINQSFVIIGRIDCNPTTTMAGGMAYFGQATAAEVSPSWTWVTADSDVAAAIVTFEPFSAGPIITRTRIRTLTQ